ncbi:GAF domain-containing protein, partial [bacterium]|nr:GAF domain-containing protein [bacterium]
MTDFSNHKRYIMQPDDLNIIVEMCKLMNTAMHYEMLLQTIIDYCTRVMQVEGASVLLYDDKQDKLIFHAATGSKSETLKKVILNTDEGIAGWVFKHKESMYSNDLEHDARFSARVDKFTRFRTHSLMATPLLLENSVIGVFELVNKNAPGGFTERDLMLCEGMAAHVALAVERVHLISENISVSRLAAIGETVAGLAHYIKNILTGLEGGAHLIRAALKEKDHATVEKVWPMAERNIDRISMLALDMLEFSKKREPYYTRQSVASVLNDIIQLFEARAKTNNVKIETDYDTSIPDCYFDSQRMHRCLLDLVGNSFDACKKISNPSIRL